MCRAVNELFADEITEMKAIIAAKDEQIRTLTDRVAQLEKRAITTVL